MSVIAGYLQTDKYRLPPPPMFKPGLLLTLVLALLLEAFKDAN